MTTNADWWLQDASRMARAVTAREVTATQLVQACLDRIAATDGRVNAFTDVVQARALQRAAQIDAGLADGSQAALPLLGVPFAAKNLFDIAGLRTLAGSKIERDSPPATADGLLVQRMEAAGAILVGALNMDEYAYGFTTENTHEGACHNPHDLARTAGGSSGWLGCGGGGGAGAAGAGLGHQWLHPRALVAVRRVRPQTHVWALAAYRQFPVCHQPGPPGAVCPQRGRSGPGL